MFSLLQGGWRRCTVPCWKPTLTWTCTRRRTSQNTSTTDTMTGSCLFSWRRRRAGPSYRTGAGPSCVRYISPGPPYARVELRPPLMLSVCSMARKHKSLAGQSQTWNSVFWIFRSKVDLAPVHSKRSNTAALHLSSVCFAMWLYLCFGSRCKYEETFTLCAWCPTLPLWGVWFPSAPNALGVGCYSWRTLGMKDFLPNIIYSAVYWVPLLKPDMGVVVLSRYLSSVAAMSLHKLRIAHMELAMDQSTLKWALRFTKKTKDFYTRCLFFVLGIIFLQLY